MLFMHQEFSARFILLINFFVLAAYFIALCAKIKEGRSEQIEAGLGILFLCKIKLLVLGKVERFYL